MQMVKRDHRIRACRPSTRTGDGGETGRVATRSTRRTVQDLASQAGQVCTADTVDPSYHAGPALTGEANSLPPFFDRDARTQLDAAHPEIDSGDFRGGMHSYVAEKTLRQKSVGSRWEPVLSEIRCW